MAVDHIFKVKIQGCAFSILYQDNSHMRWKRDPYEL